MARRATSKIGARRKQAGGRRAMSPCAPVPSSGSSQRRNRATVELSTELLAVVDVGSRALRMAVAEIAPGRPMRRLETLSVPVSVGVDTFSRGVIRAATTDAVVKTFEDFTDALRAYAIGPSHCRAAATTAVRDARNREVFLDRVYSRTGFQIEVIEAIEETRLVYQLMRQLIGPAFGKGCMLILALGAGGTHVIVQREGEIRLAETLHFGMLRLRDTTVAERIALRAARRFLSKVVRSMDRLHDLSPVDSVVVVNTELYALVSAFGGGRRSKVGVELSPASLEKLAQMLQEVTTQEIADDTSLDHAAAELARMAFEEVGAFCAPTAAQRLLFPSCSMLDSLLLDTRLRLEHASGKRQAAALAGAAESAAWSVARRYSIDEPHAAKVQELALQLFDGMMPLVGLGERSRLMLSVSAILHDVGLFISTHAPGEHSAYIIEHSEVMGLTSLELACVALVVRYHRHATASVAQIDLGHLPASERVELLKLVALLRLADALDADYCQRVRSVEVQITGNELQVLAETSGGDRESFADLARAFAAKAGLCEELFGVTPTVTETLAGY